MFPPTLWKKKKIPRLKMPTFWGGNCFGFGDQHHHHHHRRIVTNRNKLSFFFLFRVSPFLLFLYLFVVAAVVGFVGRHDNVKFTLLSVRVFHFKALLFR